MKRGFALLLSPVLLTAVIIACGDNGSPTSTTSPSTTPAVSTDTTLTAPSHISPTQGEQVEELQPELEISNSSGGSGARTYTFQVATDGGFQQIVATESGIREGLGGVTRWRVSEMLEGESRYFWRAQANSTAGAGPFSNGREFRVKAGFTKSRPEGGLVVFDPLTGGSVGQVMGGQFVSGGWQSQSNADCIRYQVPTLPQGRVEFQTTNVGSPNPVAGKRMVMSMWDPSKGDYTENPFRMHLQKMDINTVRRWDVRLRWISRTQEANTGISFFDFEESQVYEWLVEWGDFPGIQAQHVKVFLDGIEILNRNYDAEYHPNPHWIELGNCAREETLEEAIWSNVRIGTR